MIRHNGNCQNCHCNKLISSKIDSEVQPGIDPGFVGMWVEDATSDLWHWDSKFTYLSNSSDPPFWQIVIWTLRLVSTGISSDSVEIGFAIKRGSFEDFVSGRFKGFKNGSKLAWANNGL